MVAQEEELPIDRIRLVAPPELDKSLRFTLPASARPMTLRVIQGKRTAIPMPDPGNRPPTVTLEPGEVVELRRVPETFNVGLRILDLEHSRPNGQKTPMAVAVWYPTETPPQPFTYRAEENVKSRLATNAPVALKSGPYPLVVFAHGAYGSGYNSAFFTEYLASHGYIVVAPDYDDMIPPGYTRQIAFSRIKGGNTGHQIRVVTIAGLFVADMNRSRDKFFTYLAEHRLPQTSFVVDEMLRLNKTHGSPLHGAINEHAIGICGHSLGGATTLGKIGGHPDPRFKDERLKAALIFSAPAYPWENTL
ncbi:MAG: hypothetical protein FJ395_21230, partial [Verrucomicrobia bacterium]|nr:hypothetical protein [Verrucomicrobiota bacterium]